jgi:hypothetical protein
MWRDAPAYSHFTVRGDLNGGYDAYEIFLEVAVGNEYVTRAEVAMDLADP